MRVYIKGIRRSIDGLSSIVHSILLPLLVNILVIINSLLLINILVNMFDSKGTGWGGHNNRDSCVGVGGGMNSPRIPTSYRHDYLYLSAQA